MREGSGVFGFGSGFSLQCWRFFGFRGLLLVCLNMVAGVVLCVCVCLCVVCVCSLETLEGSYVFGVTALGFLCSFQELGSVRNPETLNLKMLE